MKAATGELNLTVITIVAIALVIGFFSYVFWPKIQDTLNGQWDTISGGSSNQVGENYGNNP